MHRRTRSLVSPLAIFFAQVADEIVFVEFLATAGVFARMLETAGIRFAFMFGNVGFERRKQNIRSFEVDDSCQIMVSGSE